MSNPNTQIHLESGTYEIIQNRLRQQAEDLRQRLNQLNIERKQIFSSNNMELIANQRITTDNNCVARGIMAINDCCIFAYNVHFGLKEEIKLSDVFSMYKLTNNQFEPQPLTLIEDPDFITDFTNLYKYYRDSIFAKFRKTEHYLYMVFQTTKNPNDKKVFKWLIKDKQLQYIDDRSAHEVKEPPQHDFKWTKTSLEDRRLGLHPHISVMDKLFIEAIGGDITFKIENNTDTGKGIYSEPVVNKDQQLDDAEYYYADLGNIIAIKIKPYQEEARTFVYNNRTKSVLPVKTLLEAGIVLPDNQGIIFPNGYYLQTGIVKIFESDISNLSYIRTIASPNGEDLMYVFYQNESNIYVLMSYNVIQQQVETPIICNGFTLFETGKLIYFRTEQEAIRHHQVQIWQTPYSTVLIEQPNMQDKPLYKIGNKDIVAAMAEAQEVLQLISKEDSYEGLYEDIVKKATDITDSYFWIKDDNTFNLAAPLLQIKDIANTAIDEFAKVQEQKKHAIVSFQKTETRAKEIIIRARNNSATSLDDLVNLLAQIRATQGAVADLLNVKYIDDAAVEQLQQNLQQYNTSISEDTVNFLLLPDALAPYEHKVTIQKEAVAKVSKVIDAKEIELSIKHIAGELEMLTDILNSLKIADTTQTTSIIQKIALIFASLNEVKASLTKSITALRSEELTGEFYAQMTLLEQSMVNFLDLSDTPEKCEDYFSKTSIHIEEMESKFADFDEFVLKISDKRDEVIKAFNSKKELLHSQILKRASSLEQIGIRVLKNIENKAQSLNSKELIYAFFSTDIMIEKVRSLAKDLNNIGDVAKAENLLTKLKVAQEDALRILKDKTELFVDGNNIITLGKHKFVVNKQTLQLSIIQQNEQLYYHLIGTSFYKEINAPALYSFKSVWNQELASENKTVYRSEYLAYLTFVESQNEAPNWDASLFINQKTEQDYTGGYLKGVHDVDALQIYNGLKSLQDTLGQMQFSPDIRVAAQLFWWQLPDRTRLKLQQIIQAAKAIKDSFEAQNNVAFVINELTIQWNNAPAFYPTATPSKVALYLFTELSQQAQFSCSSQAVQLKNEFKTFLQQQKRLDYFLENIQNNNFSISERFYLIQNWLSAFWQSTANIISNDYIDETACLWLFEQHSYKEKVAADNLTLFNLKGTHSVIEGSDYHLQYHHFLKKLHLYEKEHAITFLNFQKEKETLLKQYEKELKINEFTPKVLSSFVRNKLINEVYMPIIGANLAKQLGTADTNKLTARMGMLLLVSPPGYGKTTLMEYMAKIMGLHFVKINGPTIGHHITSIDPAEAKTSGAREELKKINLAFEMADNVMLYIDDIQHCSAEFLQKFISLADGQRKMDGIFENESKTYDLRGKRFCIVMAGNPYTESGEQFKIPDMLANRADVYNLGDVIGNSAHLFQLSMLENAAAESKYLYSIAQKNNEDLYLLIQYCQQETEMLPELSSNFTRQEVESAIAVLKSMIMVRDIALKVNQQYIASAAMKDAYRTEPAFKLQGSYRNMNKMAANIVPLMNQQEVLNLVLTHYEGEAQTLTSDAEGNLLKLKELMNIMSETEQIRWQAIKTIFAKNNQYGGIEQGDIAKQILVQFDSFNQGLNNIATALKK